MKIACYRHDQRGLMLGHDEHGDFVALRILDASRRVTEAR